MKGEWEIINSSDKKQQIQTQCSHQTNNRIDDRRLNIKEKAAG